MTSEAGRLQFMFSECETELRALESIGREFLDKSAAYLIPQHVEALKSIRDRPEGAVVPWGAELGSPLRTARSDGAYVRGGGGSRNLYAEIDGIWDIAPIGPHNTRAIVHRRFALAGKA